MDLVEPDATMICIADIAAGLARICRFNGQLSRHVVHYSVAQHSVIVSHILEPLGPAAALYGLMHDGH